MIAKFAKHQLLIQQLIFMQAIIATLGSLYYSSHGDIIANISAGEFFTGLGFVPCMLCWFARILMYPIVPISLVGILKQDNRFTDYVLPLSITGIFLDVYHYALQKLPIETIIPCTGANPCSAMEVNYLGFITIPLLALTAFIIITVLAIINTKINKFKQTA